MKIAEIVVIILVLMKSAVHLRVVILKVLWILHLLTTTMTIRSATRSRILILMVVVQLTLVDCIWVCGGTCRLIEYWILIKHILVWLSHWLRPTNLLNFKNMAMVMRVKMMMVVLVLVIMIYITHHVVRYGLWFNFVVRSLINTRKTRLILMNRDSYSYIRVW